MNKKWLENSRFYFDATAADTQSMSNKVNRYIDYKQRLGYKFKTESFMLRCFARYADRHAPGKPVTVELALKWASSAKSENRRYHAKRLDALRAFARYLAAFEPGTEIPPRGILGPSCYRVEPHIYTEEETVALTRTALEMKTYGKCFRTNPVRNSTIIGLLACTGMRIGEVLALNNKDVNLDESIITVRDSKNLPMRLVPIMDCTVRQLREYENARDICFGPATESGAFFLSSYGTRLDHSSFFHAFSKILESAGMKRKDSSGRRLRIHDFRHTFACNHLLRAYRENLDIDDAVHDLSVYLGHANAKATYWYLTGIPALFEQCVRRFEAYCKKPGNGGEV